MLGQLVIWYFTNFGSSALMTNWQRSVLLQGSVGSITYTETSGRFPSKRAKHHTLAAWKQSSQMSLGIWLGGPRFYFKVKNIFPPELFSMTNSTWLDFAFYLINEEWNSPLKFTGSDCSVVSLLCHYTHLWCTVYTTVGTNCSLPAPWKVIMGWESPVDPRQTTSFVL